MMYMVFIYEKIKTFWIIAYGVDVFVGWLYKMNHEIKHQRRG